ncbi:MAG: cupredoxin domain-containing protein [Solirubrobacterales bacterium]|nr:cupredoxin domain-containing protein [Solirubrobacterales bacterium]
MKPRSISLLALAASSLAIGGSVAVSEAGSRTVTLRDIEFSPERLSISKGTTVAFKFRDGTTVHDVRSTGSKRFKPISDRSSGSVSRTFTSAGTYRYVCTLHPGMSGRITVR